MGSFEMAASWAMLPAQILTLLGGPAMKYLNRICEQSATTCLMATQTCCDPILDLWQKEWISEAMNGPLTCWTACSQKAKQS